MNFSVIRYITDCTLSQWKHILKGEGMEAFHFVRNTLLKLRKQEGVGRILVVILVIGYGDSIFEKRIKSNKKRIKP